ncbi:hypothetical protein KKP04_03905 [Rhodomicrobium sp. Az07]|uniref:STING domain-containing protein n=1 Tax=Rhodomicrobium sp. Az07 TaxID=2839034 RepID=UPI001BEB3406|nr:STING domain-containing protein [Rhodomicrobium sp. Az07]MBT3070013.1 hypothetical protein [Rhodomicrobium sp. Az07]
MSRSLQSAGAAFRVITPDAPSQNVIVQMVLDYVEQADLVVIDLTGGRPNVAYEAAIIHALGIPHIFVSQDEKVPFYFSGTQVITRFNLDDDFVEGSKSATQRDLYDRLAFFLSSADARGDMSANILTSHFEGLPLVDISGPSGLALGYFINAVMRFIAPGGFSGSTCTLTIEQKKRIARLFKTRSKAVELKTLVVVEPPSLLKKDWHSDWQQIQAVLKAEGISVERGAIETEGARGKRGWSGWFYSGGIRKGVTFCIDLPTTVYPLVDSPRMTRLKKRQFALEGKQAEILKAVQHRSLEHMLAAFRRNLKYHVETVKDRKLDGMVYSTLDTLVADVRNVI